MRTRHLIIAMSVTLIQGCYTAPPYQPSSYAAAGIGYSGVNIGINYLTYPDLVQIPGYPVYYDPRVSFNFFFYDGLYWVFQGDIWYASGWYNGPWDRVDYYDLPVFILRIPVRYYRQPPPYFRGWIADSPPRWGDHWGRNWEQRRSGWDRWDRSSAPPPAPLPIYQRNYSGDRYPRAVEQQHEIRSKNYRYRPRDPEAQKYFQPRVQQNPQREQEQQRQQDQRELQRQQEQQRQQDLQRQKDQQRQQDLQRQKDQQRQQDLQRQKDLQRQQQQRQQQDLKRQQSQPEPKSKAKEQKAAPKDQVQKEKDARQEEEWKKKEDEERNRNR